MAKTQTPRELQDALQEALDTLQEVSWALGLGTFTGKWNLLAAAKAERELAQQYRAMTKGGSAKRAKG